MNGPARLVLDRDCPECGWPETFAEINWAAEVPGADAHGCSKCGWRIEVTEEVEREEHP